MFPASRIRGWILTLELMFLCRAAILKRVPLLRRLRFSVTADLRTLDPEEDAAVAFAVDFRSPYFRLPVPMERAQIGNLDPVLGLQPTSFRFFDWQTWAHIDGRIEWCGEHRLPVEGEDVDFITGFRYRVAELPADAGNLGLRLAEGVEGTVRVSCGDRIAKVQFQPVFWLLEATGHGYRPVPIQSTELMGLIVPLFDLGRGDPRVRDRATLRLERWVAVNLTGEKPFPAVYPFLKNVRDWAPLGMEPMFRGVVTVLQRLQVREPERHLFDFFADNWGVRGNRKGRRLAVKLLEAFATERARIALNAIQSLVRNQPIATDELNLIREATAKLQRRGDRMGGETE